MSHDYRDLAGNSGQKHVRLGRRMVSGSLARNAHVEFEMVEEFVDNAIDYFLWHLIMVMVERRGQRHISGTK